MIVPSVFSNVYSSGVTEIQVVLANTTVYCNSFFDSRLLIIIWYLQTFLPIEITQRQKGNGNAPSVLAQAQTHDGLNQLME